MWINGESLQRMKIDHIPVFVLHHNKLVDRKQLLARQIEAQQIKTIWIENFLPEEIQIPAGENNIRISEYSLYLKHLLALKEQDRMGFSYTLILEDDILIPNNFKEYFELIFDQFVEQQGDLMMVGKCCNLGPKEIINGQCVYWEPHFRTRCTHAILYTLSAARKIIPYLEKELIAFDHKLNDIIHKENLKSYYAEPGLLQSSQAPWDAQVQEICKGFVDSESIVKSTIR
jgi:GR25 family glycosyltransferase involved in LPS biosynthesis